MAEILIKAIDATNPDPVKDKRGCYKRGDVVDVRPDGWTWGNGEKWPAFLLLRIPGLDPNTAKKLMDPETTIDNTGPEPQVIGVRRRAWSLLVDHVALPTIIKDQVKTGVVTVTLAQVRNFVRNKVTQATL